MERMTKDDLLLFGWTEKEAENKIEFQDKVLNNSYEIIDIRPDGDTDLEEFLLHHPLEDLEILSFDLVNNVAVISGYPFSIPIDNIRLNGIFRAIIKNTNNDKFVQRIGENFIVETFILGDALIFVDEDFLHDTFAFLNEIENEKYVIVYL